MLYRHGLRVSEAIALRRDDVNLQGARLWVRRLKNSLSVEHPIAERPRPIVGRLPARPHAATTDSHGDLSHSSVLLHGADEVHLRSRRWAEG